MILNSVFGSLLPILPRLEMLKPNTPRQSLYENENFPVYKKNAFLCHQPTSRTTHHQSSQQTIKHLNNLQHKATNIHNIHSYLDSDAQPIG